MRETPFTFSISLQDKRLTDFDDHIQRRLSSMTGQYADQASFAALLASGDLVLYEVYAMERPHIEGELLHGLAVIHPGKVGDEYFMTKGHYHQVLATGEVYHCLQGHGLLVLETPEGESSVQEMRPGTVLYVPPRWAHRSVNVDPEADLVLFFVYPGHAGHDYGTIEERGFRKRVVERDGRPQVVDNPRWRGQGNR